MTNQPSIPYHNLHRTDHKVFCLTDEGHIDLFEDDGQICVTACEKSSQTDLYLTMQDAYALGLWLIAAASRIQGRYPEGTGV